LAGIPEGFHTITPQIHVSNGDKAIALYKKALGAKELHRMLAHFIPELVWSELMDGDEAVGLA
jgi:uncharacterized glyoxalase superfamily protein PhnB